MKLAENCWNCRYVGQEIQNEKRALVCNLDPDNKIFISFIVSPPAKIPGWCKKKETEINEEEFYISGNW